MDNSITSVFVKNDWDHLHDCWFTVYESKPSRDELEEMFKSLPESLQALAYEWGCNDTVFREKLIEHLYDKRENK